MNNNYFLELLFVVLFSSCSFQNKEPPFSFNINQQGVELLEDGKPVFFYQKAPKSLTGEYVVNNYIHPLYSLKGDILTEEFPVDHPYHRGIFWAWHQILINGKSVGDSWIMENVEQDVVKAETVANDTSADINLKVLWKSRIFENNKPFVLENTTIRVHPVINGIRKIDFAIALNALVYGVEIGGSNDIKGYGGFCTRLKFPDNLIFKSSEGQVIPETEQIETGPWIDFSGRFNNESVGVTGVSILCHPKTPNYPAPWILRSKTSMQNIVFPGKDRVILPMKEPLVLFYRLIVHDGNSNSIDIDKLQEAYEAATVEDLLNY